MSHATMRTPTRGLVMIHSASAALCPHIVWALEAVLDTRLTVEWSDQPAGQRLLRAEIRWNGPVGTGAQLATALRGWDNVRYEVTEEHTAISQGSRYVYTPSLGIHHSWMAPTGDVVVNEDRLREAVLASAGRPADLADEIDKLLGCAWDEELDIFRYAAEDTTVRWMHRAV